MARKACIGVPQARGRPQYCANIAMKVNAKLDGVNCALATVQPFMQRPFMVIGELATAARVLCATLTHGRTDLARHNPVCMSPLCGTGALYEVAGSGIAGTGVTHPMGYCETEPSVAAVVGSMDAKCSRYSAEVQLQGHRIEIIQVVLLPSLPQWPERGEGEHVRSPAPTLLTTPVAYRS